MLLVLNIFMFFQDEMVPPIIIFFALQLAFFPASLFIRQTREYLARISALKPTVVLSIADLSVRVLKVLCTSP